ncbi:SusD/RagB family nutrient-binding outer membrane lipoprotein [Antarcticibacterium sp. 1MA-6-2]|uniref:SusD/RagB family nutrient-binding outer membrane lipoprotein n=1 Tax=Antarcticibacterium sp. 1MA-6-2 TaxID=2908210 RepID=UPI001F337198|nr:SusD/RagB family nutrient-binding outer membrane lipoprotein [Antarcticibacterium sp. 1MA-6-2]UJH90730.1 SusD/RagB family nutrient-binding outer membrane lipoprotein [Antarcticibacterium sp. 1MA-6-2]
MKNTYKGILFFLMIFAIGCDKEDFAELNSNPSTVSEPELRFSITKAVEQMYGNDYTSWFYNAFDYTYPWSQVVTGGVNSGNTEGVVEMGPTGDQNIYASLIPTVRDIRARIDAMSPEQQEERRAMRAMTFPIQIQLTISLSDYYGSIIYSEAGMAPYTSPPLITPKYDSQEELFDIWLAELDAAIEDLLAPDQFEIGAQDVIYGGDYTKWAKFCNLLKLKIAARLVNADRAKALGIVAEVINSPAGYMSSLEDDFIYQRGIEYFGTGEGVQPGIGGENLIDFMVDNKDPRVRVLFEKNSFNGEVVQAFIDAGKPLPPYVEQYVQLDGSGNFAGWSGPGEPWVRYFGAPLAPDAVFEGGNDFYFNQGIVNRINLGGVEKTYESTSDFNERVVRTGYPFVYPTKPGGRVLELRDNYPPLEVILGSSAETYLYLAEFKLLGANIPGEAQEYFNRGVELSVGRLDELAENNRFPYYNEDPVYTNAELAAAGATALKSGEIQNLLSQPAYDLSSNGLEKVYIQQYINFAATPGDLWTTVRRSGIPKRNSEVFAWDPLLAGGSELIIPRRFMINTPTQDNKNFQNAMEAYTNQGFTTGTNDPNILNNERIWWDEENPDYGAGPIQ